MRRLGVFAKYWRPGAVKTRLAVSIGHETASRLHRCCVATLTRRFAEVADQRILFCWPAESATEFQALAPAWNVAAQEPGNLGERMADYFERGFASGADRIVLIGSDSPTMPAAVVEDAFLALASEDVVLGPTVDGGYYLIGASRRDPPVFDEVLWSTDQVWSQTLDRLRSARWSWRELPEWYDVDELADLKRLAAELERNRADEFDELRALIETIDVANLPPDAIGMEPG